MGNDYLPEFDGDYRLIGGSRLAAIKVQLVPKMLLGQCNECVCVWGRWDGVKRFCPKLEDRCVRKEKPS